MICCRHCKLQEGGVVSLDSQHTVGLILPPAYLALRPVTPLKSLKSSLSHLILSLWLRIVLSALAVMVCKVKINWDEMQIRCFGKFAVYVIRMVAGIGIISVSGARLRGPLCCPFRKMSTSENMERQMRLRVFLQL